MNKKILSMLISILLVGLTLVSAGIFYFMYQSDLQTVQERQKEYKKEWKQQVAEAEKEADEDYYKSLDDYQKRLMDYNQKKKELEKQVSDPSTSPFLGKPNQYMIDTFVKLQLGPVPFEPGRIPPDDVPLNTDKFDSQRHELAKQFESTLIIHGIIITFIIIAELGLLLVLPKRTNFQNINLDIQKSKKL